jgi:thiosulfate/3-mercaptopyruvate sulfurtransferase
MLTGEISTRDLAAGLTDSDFVILDVRPIAAYNGWSLRGEPRGGHIRGAIAFPLRWTDDDTWPELLKTKNVTADNTIIVYGYDNADSAMMADKLRGAGYRNVRTYGGFDEWAGDETCPKDRLPRYEKLVYPGWVKDLLDGKKPATYGGNGYVVCHSSFDHREDYDEGHIPGAVHIDTLWLESPKTWNRRSPEEIQETLLKLGIRRDTTVILYGRFSYPDNEDPLPGRFAGHLSAMRCALIMLYAGVEDVRILNGGIMSWLADGYEITTKETHPEPANDFGAKLPAQPKFIVDTPKARELLAADDGELVSVRSWNEFIGDVSGYHYVRKAGRIPGAVFGNCGSDAYHMENYRNIDHTIREHREVAARWAENGIIPEKHIAFYCGTGWRASEAFLNAYLMGWPRISVYDGGWFEWSNDPDNPVETGEPTAVAS